MGAENRLFATDKGQWISYFCDTPMTTRKLSDDLNEPPPLKWSDLKYVFWHQGGPKCRGSVTSLKRLSPS